MNHGYLSAQAARVGQMTPSPVERKVGSSPPKRWQEYAESCRFIQSKALDSIKPGVKSADICAVAEAATREIGFQQFRRSVSDAISAQKGSMIGHGLGFSVHEFPLIAPTDQMEWDPFAAPCVRSHSISQFQKRPRLCLELGRLGPTPHCRFRTLADAEVSRAPPTTTCSDGCRASQRGRCTKTKHPAHSVE
jgi:hypothetical protein